jgi:hypothetical protein
MLEFCGEGETVNSSSTESVKKKPYSTPVIRVYGDIRVVTQSASMTLTHMGDGGNGNTKT